MTRDKFIFDQIVDGLTECLLCETDFTLENAVALAQRSKVSKSQRKAYSFGIQMGCHPANDRHPKGVYLWKTS